MISGISSRSTASAHQFIAPAQSAPRPATPCAASADAAAKEVAPIRDDADALARDHTLFDLATRQFDEILPRLEQATAVVE